MVGNLKKEIMLHQLFFDVEIQIYLHYSALFRNKRIMLDEITYNRNTLKFAIFLEYEKQFVGFCIPKI